MRDDESKYSKHELEAEQELEEQLKLQGYTDEEAERRAWNATTHEPGGNRKSDTRSGDRKKDQEI